MSKQILRLVGGGLAVLGAAILAFAVYSFLSQQQLEARLEAQVPGANPIATSTLAAFAAPSNTPAAPNAPGGANPVSPSVTPFPTHATPVQPDATLAASLAGTPTAILLNSNGAAGNNTALIANQTVTRTVSSGIAANVVKPTGVPRGTGAQAARLKIPRLGLDTPVEEANFVTYQQNGQLVSDWNVPYHAAGHLINSAQPGEIGNSIFSGHHNLTAPNTFGLGLFAGLWNLTVGDEIEIATKDNKTLVWRVTDSFPVKEGGEPLSVRIMHAQQIMSDTSKPTITLLTCWNGQTNPLSGNLYRWVIHAELVAEN